MSREDTHERGLEVRRAVHGDWSTDAALARTTALSAECEAPITRYAFGEIGSLPRLERTTRRLGTPTAPVALGAGQELVAEG